MHPQILRCDPAKIAPQAFSARQGIALEAVSSDGQRIATVAARVDGQVAVLFEEWITGEPDLLAMLVSDLIRALREEFGVRDVRAGASSQSLYDLYVSRIGMLPWHELLTYERPALPAPDSPRSTALLRPFAARDVEAVAELLAAEDGPPGPDVPGTSGGAAGAASHLRMLAEKHPSRFIVAEVDGQIAGYALGHFDGGRWLFKSMIVHTRFRQQGIGRDLVLDQLRCSHHLGLPSFLHTQADNQPARLLYEKLGYHLVKQVRLVHQMLP